MMWSSGDTAIYRSLEVVASDAILCNPSYNAVASKIGTGLALSAFVIILLHEPTGNHSLGFYGFFYNNITAMDSGDIRV